MNNEQTINQIPEENQPESPQETKIPSDNIPFIVAIEEQTIPYNLQPSNEMEVHHHPNVEKKNLKEYLLEGLMIFLAVTMGYFAENVREHLGETKKETEYIKGLIEDFENDTSRINTTIMYNEGSLNNDTSFIRLLYGSKTDTVNLKSIYARYPATGSFDPEFIDSRTFDLLKNTGDLKLIKNKIILNKVSNYYRLTALEKIFSNEIQTMLVNTYNFSNKCFDFYAAEKLRDKQLKLITSDDDTIKEYSNYLYQLTKNLMEYKKHLLNVKKEATALIEITKKEYHLTHEK